MNPITASAESARADLNATIKLLKRGGVSQNAIARSAGYSPGYVTQLLSDKYPVERLVPSAISRLVKSANSFARRSALGPEDARELERLLAGLSATYVATLPEVYGMDGDMLDHREAAQFQETEAGRRLREDVVHGHNSYSVVQVSGAPGQGKTWTLANLAREAAATHEVVWVDFERLALEDDRDRAPEVQMGRDVRRAQQRYYRVLERVFDLRDVVSAGQDVEPGAVVDRVEQGLRRIDGVTGERTADVVAGLRRLLDRERLAGLPRRGRAGRHLEATGDDPADQAVATGVAEYTEDDLAEDLGLLWCLADAAALADAAPDSREVTEARKLLVLVDSPDRRSEIASLLQTLRSIATILSFNPECHRVLIVVSKTESGARAATLSSVVRRWYPLESFTREDVRRMIGILTEHGWFRDGAVATPEAHERLIEQCDDLCGFNRRASCMYLDQCHSASRVIPIEEYLGSGEDADERVPKWVEAWAQRVLFALVARKRRDRRDEVLDNAEPLIVVAQRWLSAPGPVLPPANPVLLSFAKAFGLVVDSYDPTLSDRGAASHLVVPALQQLVCGRLKALLDRALEEVGS
jgi:hypothetical protein